MVFLGNIARGFRLRLGGGRVRCLTSAFRFGCHADNRQHDGEFGVSPSFEGRIYAQLFGIFLGPFN